MCPFHSLLNAVRMDVSSKTKLNQQLAFSYKSFAGSSQLADDSSPSGFTCGLDRNYGERMVYKFTICNNVAINCLIRVQGRKQAGCGPGS